jgi:hypothetical protein
LPALKRAPNEAETRCMARLWQGRADVNFSAVIGVVPAPAFANDDTLFYLQPRALKSKKPGR